MNENYSNNNTNYAAMNDDKKWNGIDFSGPHTVFHRHCFQMVDLLTRCCRRSMHGLNPCALPHAPPQCQEEINKMNVKHEEKDLKPNLAKPKPCDGHSKQGWKMHAKKREDEQK